MSAIVRSPCTAVNVATQRTVYKQIDQSASATDYQAYSKCALALAFNRPATSIGGEDLPCRPIKLGTVEHLIGAFPFHVVRQDDGQQSILARFVVQGLGRLDCQGGMQPELVKLQFSPRLVRIVGPLLHAGQAVSLLSGRSFAFLLLGRCRLVECSLGMDMADEVNVGRQVREDALTSVGAVTGDDDLIVGEPLSHHVDEVQSQLRPGAMIRILLGLGGFLLALFPLRTLLPL